MVSIFYILACHVFVSLLNGPSLEYCSTKIDQFYQTAEMRVDANGNFTPESSQVFDIPIKSISSNIIRSQEWQC